MVKRGRPTKLTSELQEKLCALLSEGWFLRHACAEVEIDEHTALDWIKAGQSETASQELQDFSSTCTRARASGERKLLEEMHAFAVESLDWKMTAWKLERLNREVYHLSTKTEVTGANGGPIQVRGPTIMIPPESAD